MERFSVEMLVKRKSNTCTQAHTIFEKGVKRKEKEKEKKRREHFI
jgi:hypothetical protein